MKYNNITVFGGGNAAFAAAACLSLQGCKVTLCDFAEFTAAIQPVKDKGFIDLIRQDGPFEGQAKVHAVTTDLGQAIRDADLVILACQAAAHGRVAREAAKLLRDGQHVLLLPGTCFGAFEFRSQYAKSGGTAKIVVAESNTFICATRRTKVPHQSLIKHWATEVFISAYPAKDTELLLKPFQALFPQCIAAADTLETCLLNLNPYVHSAPAVLSISAVERCELAGKDFFHYVDGITASTAKVMISLDKERVEICRLLGYRDWNVAKMFYRAGYMGQLTGDWIADMQSKPVLREAKGPFSPKYRYYTEDTGVGLVVVYSIGRALGLQMPTHYALIHLCGIFNDVDYIAVCTRSLEALGIAASSPSELKRQFVG